MIAHLSQFKRDSMTDPKKVAPREFESLKSLLHLVTVFDDDDSAESPPKRQKVEPVPIDVIAVAQRCGYIPTPQRPTAPAPLHDVAPVVEEIEDDVEASMTMVPFEFSIEPDEVGATLFGVEDPRPLDDEKVVALVVGVDIPKAPVPVVHVEDPVPLAEDAEAIATAGVTVDDPVPLAEDAEAIAPARVNVEAQAPAGVNVEAQAPVGVNVEKKEVNNVDIDALLAKPAEVILPNEVADLRAEVEAKKEEEKEKLNAEKEERKRLREEAKVAREAAKAAKKEEKALAKVTAKAYKEAEKNVIKAQRATAKAADDEFKAAKLELENAKNELHSASNGGSGGGGSGGDGGGGGPSEKDEPHERPRLLDQQNC